MTKRILVRYSAQKAAEPILASIIRETGALVNILYADMDSKGGEILISVEESDVGKVLPALQARAVEFEEIKKAVKVDWDTCVHCGACVSLCPTQALWIGKDASLNFDEEKCVFCEACIPACPVRAIKFREI